MLHEFLTLNRNALIQRCREKVTKRHEPQLSSAVIDNGVPLFLQQLVDTLRREAAAAAQRPVKPIVAAEVMPAPAPSEIGRAAALHGAELLRLGYRIDQVVHEYGDICQSISELAVELNAPFSTEEFQTLNRCLDNAIADAVTAYWCAGANVPGDQTSTLHDRQYANRYEHRRLVDIAIESLAAISTGSVPVNGATGTLLRLTLGELRTLTERTLPAIHRTAVNTNTTTH